MAEAIYPDLDGKVAVVTGGGSGIGAEIVRQFALQGTKVGFLDIADGPSKAIAAEFDHVHYERADVTDIDAVRDAIAAIRERFGPVGIMVNNAAHDDRHKLEDVTVEYWDNRFAVNLRHQFFCTQAVVDDMKSLGGGAVLNMNSTSWMLGSGGMVAYTAAKSATLGLTRSLAHDLGPFGIRVNSLAPGWIQTERQRTLWVKEGDIDKLMEQQCLKRELMPIDIARVVLFLCSDAAGACTNQDFVVDAGQT